MPLLPYGEWKPDVSDFEGSAVYSILNVIPRGDGYGPFPDFAAATQALPSACRGAFYALKSDGTVQVYAGTSTGLYRLNNTDLSWIPVSRVTTATITAASPGVVTEAAHGAAVNDPKVFTNSGGALPAAITAGTTYYVKTVLTPTPTPSPRRPAARRSTQQRPARARTPLPTSIPRSARTRNGSLLKPGVLSGQPRQTTSFRSTIWPPQAPSRTRWEARRRPHTYPSSAALSCSPAFSRSPTGCSGPV
jgi:hypothetical protein